ncbi:CD209 antigen-like protein E [Acanthochromis polyacanthus]|uniref:CD209 antigen-like protein E n=1 Tax=Acanthochromis polyacanthus TaxID=80966 RepID=UPI002234901F|nr:CD209 antigen-like protein E [Acanthochromis polyacanthus]
MIRPQRDTEDEAAESRPVRSNTASKLTLERVLLLLLSALLAAALIVIYRLCEFLHIHSCTFTSFNNIRTNEDLKMKCETGHQSLSDEPCPKCEAGWENYGGKCYNFTTNKSSWEESRRFCQSQGGDLVKIDSRDEQSFLERRLRDVMEKDQDKFWIGLTDSKEEGRWLWVDGSLLDERLKFWSPGQPDNWKGTGPDGQDCVRMGEKDGAHDLNCWFDHSCKNPHRSICEKPEKKGQRVSVCV